MAYKNQAGQIIGTGALDGTLSGNAKTLPGNPSSAGNTTPIKSYSGIVADVAKAIAPPTTPQTGVGVNQSNKLNSETLNNGMTSGSIQLPSANTQAQQVYTDKTINDSTATATNLNQQLNDIKAQQLKEAETAKAQAEADLKLIQDNEQKQLNNYDTQVNPLKDQITEQYKKLTDSISGVDYKSLVESKVSLTNDIINYSKMMQDELTQESANPGLSYIKQGRNSSIKENYTSKIATSQAALQAIDGNFSLAFDILDKGSNAITQMTNDRINFLNTVKNFYATDKANATTKVLNLTAEEKGLIERSITDLQTKIKNVEDNKLAIQKIMEENPIVANKAGLLLTDTPEQRTAKLNKLYVKYPQYTPDNQAFIKKAMEKYYDAGITLNDSMTTVQSKLKNSKIYQKDTGNFTFETNPTTGATEVRNQNTGDVSVIPPQGTVGGQCGDYLHKILDGLPAVGDTVASKKAAMNMTPQAFASSPQIGDVLAFNIGAYGHVAVVTGVNGNQVTLNESNFGLDEKVGNRTISANDPTIVGAYRGATFNSNITKTKAQLELEQKQQDSDKQKQNALAVKQTALDLITELKNSPAINFATGLMTAWSNVPGTEAYYFAQKFNTLRDLLAMGNIDKLKGAMSDKDIEFLRNSATSLKLGLKSADFKAELDKLTFKLNNPTSSTQDITNTSTVGRWSDSQASQGRWQSNNQ